MRHRVAIISDHASPMARLGGVDSGGQNVYVAEIATQLAAEGHEVDVYTRQDCADLPTVCHWRRGVRVIHVPVGPPRFVPKEALLPFMTDFGAFMIDFIREHNIAYSIVHANFFMSGFVAVELKEKTGIPFVITFHALGKVRGIYQRNADSFPIERLFIEDRIVMEADRVIAECPQDANDLLELYAVYPNKLRLLPCGVDSQRFAPRPKAQARAMLGLADEKPVILQLGRMVPRKGVDDVIQSMEVLRKRHHTAAHLLVVGGESDVPNIQSDRELARLNKIAQDSDVEEQVTFVGRRSHELLSYYYSAADLFVTTPWYEPFGITPLEAMACGIPVVGASVGGIKYSVVHKRTGYLVPPRDPEAIAAHVARLLRSPSTMKEYGMHGIERVRTRFAWNDIARSLAHIYDEVVER